MRIIRVLLCAALALPGAATAADLLKVYDLAVQNDATLRAAASARDAAVEVRPQARAALLPQVTGSYGYSETSETGDESFNGGVSAAVDRDSSNSGLTVTLNQSLINWEYIKRLSQSGDQVTLAETTYRSAQQALTLRVAEAYFGVLAASDNLRSADAQNKAVERQLEQAKKRFEVGLSAITDVQEAQAKYDLTVADQIASRQALSAAQEILAEITGAPAAQPIAALQDEIPLPAPDPGSINSWISAAAEGNLDVLSARYVHEIASVGVSIAWARHLPTLAFQGQYQDSTADGSRFSGDTRSETLGVQVNIPIFAGFATQSGVRQARATREQRKAEYEGRQRLVERQTRDAYQGVISGASLVKARRQAELSSTTALEASETGLQVGARTAVDVLNAQQQLFDAERNYSRARYDYLISVLRLKSAAGRLGVNDLAEIDRLLVQS